MRPIDVRDFVIAPTLAELAQWQPAMKSPAAVNLLLGVAAVESRFYYLKQHPTGPALGLWQVEPETHKDNWDNYLAYRSEAASIVRGFSEQHDAGLLQSLQTSLRYCCAHARIKLWRVDAALPRKHDVQGMAVYWRRYYNAGRGDWDKDIDRFHRAYNAFVRHVGAEV